VSGTFRRPSAQPSIFRHNRTSQLNMVDSFERTISQIGGGVGPARRTPFIPCSAVLSVSTLLHEDARQAHHHVDPCASGRVSGVDQGKPAGAGADFGGIIRPRHFRDHR
jgi:hypothetical protein